MKGERGAYELLITTAIFFYGLSYIGRGFSYVIIGYGCLDYNTGVDTKVELYL